MTEIRDMDVNAKEAEKAAAEGKKLNTSKSTNIKISQIPANYLPIYLSSNGMLGVPRTVHVRNFNTSDLLDISMYSESVLPSKVISVLNSMIYESVDVADWPERVIIELLIRIYANFFTPMMTSISFPWDETDVKYLTGLGRDQEVSDLIAGKWKPVITLDLTSVQIKDLPAGTKSKVVINKKFTDGTSVSAKFISYPKYGDIIQVRNLMEKMYRDSDKTYAKIKQDYELRDNFIKSGTNLQNLPVIDEYEYDEWQIYEATKAIYAMKASQALYLLELNGEDVSNLDLDTKIQKLALTQYDVKMAQKIQSEYDKLDYGLNPEVKVLNPITKQECVRSFYFRELDILQAIQSDESNEYDISYDD
jgi:hypothetical protein